MIWKIILGLFLWTVAAVIYVMINLGNKHRRVSKLRNTLEHILASPVIPIAYIIGWFVHRSENRKK